MKGGTSARLARLESLAGRGVARECVPWTEHMLLAARGVLLAHCGAAGGVDESAVIALAERVAAGQLQAGDAVPLDALRACGVEPVDYLGIMRRLYMEF